MVLRSTMSRLLAVLIVSIFTAVVSPPAHAATEKPCCEITAIDGRANTATARDLATGRVFQFVTPKAATNSALKVGQRIFANFAANMVSLDGVKQCCKIIPAAAATPSAIPAAASKPTVTPSQATTAATSRQPNTTTSSTSKTVSTIKPTEAMMPP